MDSLGGSAAKGISAVMCLPCRPSPLVGVLTLAGALGCTEFAAGTDELASEQNAATGVPGDEWGCLARPSSSPPVPVDRTRPLTYRGTWIDIGTRAPPPNLRARACGIADPTCSDPITPFVAADASGVVQLTLYHGFVGYLEVTSDITLPNLAFFPATLTADTSSVFQELVPRTLVQPADYVNLGLLNGIVQDPTTGYVAIFALNCAGKASENVAYALNNQGSAVRFYFSNNFPSITLQSTTPDGLGGFANVPGGLATVSATRVATGELVRTASLFVRSGWGSHIVLGPYQSPDSN
ncbi:MAG: hypothetical protein RL685_7271 [Pseudomonadota bacterium]|jgi:hypothetical protein